MMPPETSNRAATTARGWLADDIAELEQDPEYVAGALALDVIEQALERMERQEISRSQLAERMGVSRAYVTRLFDAPPNLTLQSIARLALALGVTPHVNLASVSNGPGYRRFGECEHTSHQGAGPSRDVATEPPPKRRTQRRGTV